MTLRRPEDILPEDQNTATVNGVQIRKGTVASFFSAAGVFSDPETNATDKAKALALLKELAPALKALNISQQITFKNPDIEKIFNEK